MNIINEIIVCQFSGQLCTVQVDSKGCKDSTNCSSLYQYGCCPIHGGVLGQVLSFEELCNVKLDSYLEHTPPSPVDVNLRLKYIGDS